MSRAEGDARVGTLRIRSYCVCGAKLDAFSEPPDAAEAVHLTWRGIHSGEGHGGCGAATARRARARALAGAPLAAAGRGEE